MIRMKDVCQFHGKQLIFENVDLHINRNEVCVLVGSNGIGKSTFFKTMLGLLPGYKGSIQIMGQDIKKSKAWKKHVFYLPEQFQLYPQLTVYENMEFFAMLENETAKEIDAALKLTGMDVHKNKKAKELSKGMLQRLGLSLAFLGQTEMLILDEPTSGIDPEGQKEMLKIIDLFRMEGKTVVFSSHHMSEIEKVATHVILFDGKNVSKMTKELFRTHYLQT